VLLPLAACISELEPCRVELACRERLEPHDAEEEEEDADEDEDEDGLDDESTCVDAD